jgi:hypothetical protein
MNREFLLLLFVPWALDLLGGRGVLASVFGALLWGIAVAISYARSRTHDPRFRRRLGFVLGVVAGAWLIYWLLWLTGPPPIYLGSQTLKWLTLLHAGILAAGCGMVLVLAVASLLWLAQDFLLRKNSWQRRKSPFFKKLPPLESLARVAEGALHLAFSSWGAGFLLAMLAAFMRWRATRDNVDLHSLHWLWDWRILLTAGLWILLSLTQQFSPRIPSGSPWLYRGYLIVSVFFVIFFTMLLPGGGQFHDSITWFVRP